MPHLQLWRGYHTTPVLALATHRKPQKSYRAQPALLYTFLPLTPRAQALTAEDPHTTGAVSRVGEIYLSGRSKSKEAPPGTLVDRGPQVGGRAEQELPPTAFPSPSSPFVYFPRGLRRMFS